MDLTRREDPQLSPVLFPCDYDLLRIVKDPLHGRWFGTEIENTNTVKKQMARFTYGEENGKEDGVRHWQHVLALQEPILKVCIL